MRRPTTRRSFRLESLESRELLTAGGPSAEAQYMLTELNLARINPAAAAQQFTSNLSDNVNATLKYYNVDLGGVRNAVASEAARPPLAWNATLAGTAGGQSQYQNDTGVQSHAGANGSNLEQRLDQAGYTGRASDGENAYAYSGSVDEAMQAFLIDWGVASNGHRNNIYQPTATPDQFYQEVGIGIVDSSRGNFGPEVITQDFGRSNTGQPDVLGVVYNDPSHVNRFTLGSGVGGVEVDATNNATGALKSTTTWDAGGYQIPLTPGNYTIAAKVNGQTVQSNQITVNNQNVEVDANLTNLPAPAPAPAPAVVAPAPVVQVAPAVVAPAVAPPAIAVTAPPTPASAGWTTWHAATAS